MKPTESDVQQILGLIRQRREIIDAERAGRPDGLVTAASFTVEQIMNADVHSPELEAVYVKARAIGERLGPDGMDDMVEAMWDHDPQGRGISALEQLWNGVHGWVP